MFQGSKPPKPFTPGEQVLLRTLEEPWFDGGTYLGEATLPDGTPGYRVQAAGDTAPWEVPEFFVHREGPEAWAWKSAVTVLRQHRSEGASLNTLAADEGMARQTAQALFRLHPSADVRRTLP